MEQNTRDLLFSALPADVTKIIFNKLNAKDFARCTRVNIQWNRDLVFLLDEVYLTVGLLRHKNYYLDNIKKFSCIRMAISFDNVSRQPEAAADLLYPLIMKLPKLAEITLNEERLSPSPLQVFSVHKQIKKLHYDHLVAEKIPLTYLAEYTQLIELDIYIEVPFVAEFWKTVSSMPKLRRLSIKARGPNPNFIVNWNAVSSLESLKLENVTFRPFDSAPGSDISVMTNLKHLTIHGPYSGDMFTPLLTKHTQLRELSADALNKFMLSSPAFQHLTSLKCDRALRIDETVSELPNLVSLAWRPSTSSEIDYISSHSQLTYLELRGTYYEGIEKLTKLTNLKHLAIRVPMTKEIASVLIRLPKLDTIDSILPDNTSISDYKNNFHRTFNLPDHLLLLLTLKHNVI